MDLNWDQLRAPNLFASFAQGQQYGQKQKQYRQEQEQYEQSQRARNMFANGDDQGAERGFIQAGDIPSANAIHSRRNDDRRLEARGKAVDALGAGKMDEARQSAIGAGDDQLAAYIDKMDERQRATVKEHSQQMASALYEIRDLPPAEQAARWGEMSQRFAAEGYKPEELAIDFNQPGAIQKEISDALTVKEKIEAAERSRHNLQMERRTPQGFTYGEDGNLEVDPGYVAGKRQIAGATRAPPRTPSGAGAPGGGARRKPWED
jgi:hypothetical protein